MADTSTMPTALITGITGQDGYYLSELLLRKGYFVHGVVRRTSDMRRHPLHDMLEEHPEFLQRVFLRYGDVTDAVGMIRRILDRQLDEVYNLAAQSGAELSTRSAISLANMSKLPSSISIAQAIQN